MNFKRYLNKIQGKNKERKSEVKEDFSEEIKSEAKKILSFVDENKDPHEYLKRYLMEAKYQDWFNRNYPNSTIYDAVGLSALDYLQMKRELFPESGSIREEIQSTKQEKPPDEPNFKPTYQQETKSNYEEFIDDRILVSHNAFGNK